MELGGKTAIVTGAGRGIGRDISLRLAEEGCNLALVSRTGKQLEEVKEEIECINSKAIIFPGDISEKGSISKIIEETMEHFNSIDILINNAAAQDISTVISAFQQSYIHEASGNFQESMDVLKDVYDEES
ncbi:MAG: SDR family NAD(P)-dependent oxidoreductase, partial [Candidatus Humimicrobiaceae bacterium]